MHCLAHYVALSPVRCGEHAIPGVGGVFYGRIVTRAAVDLGIRAAVMIG